MFAYVDFDHNVKPLDPTYIGYNIYDNCTNKSIKDGVEDCGDRFEGKYRGWYCLNEKS